MHKEPSWRAKAMYIVFAFALVFGLAGVVAMPPTERAGADPGYTEIGASFDLTAGGGDDAEWRTTQVHPNPETLTAMGVSSAWIDKDTGGAGSTCVQFTPPAGTTFSDFQAAITAGTPKWSFWHWLQNIGVTNGPQFELRFEDPNSTGWLEVTAVGLQGTTGTDAWLEEILAGTTPAGYGGWGEAGVGAPFFNWGPLTPLSGILTAVNGEANVGSAGDWVLERVRVELWEAINQSCYVDDITIDDERYDLEQGYRIIPETVAKDVKGTEQKFVILNLPMGMSDIEFLTYANPAQAMDDAQTTNVSLEVVAWEVIPGLKKSSVGAPGSGADIIITGGGGPTYVGVDFMGFPYNGAGNQNWIKIWTRDPGDANIVAWLDEDLNVESMEGADKDIRLITEKKWGDIDHTILDLDPATAIFIDPVTKQIISGQETSVTYVAGTGGVPEYELVDDWIYAWFYKSPVPSTFIDSVGHAVVHWWLIVDDAADLNEAAIDAIMADLSADGCGTYVDWPDAWGTPFSRIDAVATADPSTKFTFSAVTEGTLWPDPNVDGTFNNDADLNGVIDTPLDTYIKTMTEDDLLGETRGLVEVELENTGQESILIITLSEYPWPYAGENPVCIEKGKKTWTGVPPPPEIVKTPQLRWAGEKIVLEQNWANFMEPSYCYVAVYHHEEQSVGEISIAGGSESLERSEGDIWVLVNANDPISEVLLETEVQGEADVNVKLYKATGCDEGGRFDLDGPPILNYGFLVYFLAFEDVVMAEDITPDASLKYVDPAVAIDVAVQVRGWFQSDELPGTTRPAVDFDPSDLIIDLPYGRYVMPDDWWGMVGNAFDYYPNMDLMDKAHHDTIDSGATGNSLGAFNNEVRTTDPPNVAQRASIGPFNTLQRWSTDLMWIADADTVPTSHDTVAYQGTRNTVVPDGEMSSWDAPMPQALVSFDIVDSESVVAPSLSALLKSNLGPKDVMPKGYGFTGSAPKVYESPFYQAEIPSHLLIPSVDYDWKSWNENATDSAANSIDDPYPFWTDLMKKSLYLGVADNEPTVVNHQDVEVYCDNHGIAGVTVDALGRDGSVTITATAMYPAALKAGKYAPRVSDDIVVSTGPLEFDPDFIGTPRICATAECEVTFTNLTSGGVGPLYNDAHWDFGDGTPIVEGEAIQPGETYTHTYLKEGDFDVTLHMWDAEDTYADQTEYKYITVGEGGVATVTLTMEVGIAQAVASFNLVYYSGETVSLATLTPPSCLVAVYYYDPVGMELLYYLPGSFSNMTQLTADTSYIIIVDDATVADPCEWEITQP